MKGIEHIIARTQYNILMNRVELGRVEDTQLYQEIK